MLYLYRQLTVRSSKLSSALIHYTSDRQLLSTQPCDREWMCIMYTVWPGMFTYIWRAAAVWLKKLLFSSLQFLLNYRFYYRSIACMGAYVATHAGDPWFREVGEVRRTAVDRNYRGLISTEVNGTRDTRKQPNYLEFDRTEWKIIAPRKYCYKWNVINYLKYLLNLLKIFRMDHGVRKILAKNENSRKLQTNIVTSRKDITF